MIANACLALVDVMTELQLVNKEIIYTKVFEAEDLIGLIYDVLNYILLLFDTNDLLFNEFIIDLNENANSLSLTARGEKYNPKKHIMKTHIKAVTFFGMEFQDEGLKVTLDL